MKSDFDGHQTLSDYQDEQKKLLNRSVLFPKLLCIQTGSWTFYGINGNESSFNIICNQSTGTEAFMKPVNRLKINDLLSFVRNFPTVPTGSLTNKLPE